MEFSVQQEPVPRTVEGLQRAAFPDRAGASVNDPQTTENDWKA